MTTKQKQELLRVLSDLLTRGPANYFHGICYEIKISEISCKEEDFLFYISDWPKHSGYTYFPIIDTTISSCAEDQYYSHSDLWKGTQGELRKELLEYTIKKLKADLTIKCGWCDKQVSIRKDGRIRKHQSGKGRHHICSGSDQFPEDCPYDKEGNIKLRGEK